MKKQRIINYGILILSCMFFYIAFRPAIREFSCLFRYQNTGRIHLEIDGNEEILNNIDIDLILDEESVETKKITKGKFKFWEGDCGSTLDFKIPAELYEGQTDISFEVDFISGDHGAINDFNINISITTGDEIKVYANGFVKNNGHKDPYDFEAVSKEITEKNNIIKLYASNI